jgi:hypothetical protein
VRKLKLASLPDETTIKLTVELPPQVDRDLMAYSERLAAETGQAIAPAKLIAPMLARFMATLARARPKIVPKSHSPQAAE